MLANNERLPMVGFMQYRRKEAFPRALQALGLIAVLMSWSPASAADRAEIYAAVYGGVTQTEPLREVAGTGPLSAVTFSNITLMRSGVGGIKLGVFLPGGDDWMGVETEAFYSTPHIKQQDLTVTAPGVTTTTNFAGARVRVATAAVNWILRYPGKYFQPYVGAGPGVFWGRMSGDEFGTGSDTSLGLNALVGARILLASRLGVFAEYKYNRVSFDFEGTTAIRTLYQAHHGVVGLSLHF
jgi:opacity protein-like surface antigen